MFLYVVFVEISLLCPYTIYGFVALFAPDFCRFWLVFVSFSITKQKISSKNARKYEHLENSTKIFLKICKKVAVYVVVFTPKYSFSHSANLYLS